MTADLRDLAERAASWQLNGVTPEGNSFDWEAFQRAASPDVVLGLLDDLDKLREALRGQIVRRTPDGPCWCWPLNTEWHEGWVHSPLCDLARAALQESPDDR